MCVCHGCGKRGAPQSLSTLCEPPPPPNNPPFHHFFGYRCMLLYLCKQTAASLRSPQPAGLHPTWSTLTWSTLTTSTILTKYLTSSTLQLTLSLTWSTSILSTFGLLLIQNKKNFHICIYIFTHIQTISRQYNYVKINN